MDFLTVSKNESNPCDSIGRLTYGLSFLNKMDWN